MQKHNFSAGPAILPQEVLNQASEAIKNFDGTGLSLIEVSHRGKEFVAVMDEAKSLVKEILDLNDDFEVLFLQGGASTQFAMIPYNFLNVGQTAAYMETGTWAGNAFKEAKLFGNAVSAGSSKDKNFNYIPKNINIPSDSAYFHYTTNNTIYGTEITDLSKFDTDPRTLNIPLIADMSSDIFSCPIDANKHALIYAGAQKNLGPAGTTLVIINKNAIKKADRVIPTMLDYNTHIAKESMFNTPPVFPVYVCMLTLRWIKAKGGLQAMAKRNQEKGDLLYNAIDSLSLFEGTAAKEDRSLMNVTFVLKDNSLDQEFLQMATDAGIVGIKGHRSVGGFRASIYNAIEIDSVQVLVDVMTRFEQKHA